MVPTGAAQCWDLADFLMSSNSFSYFLKVLSSSCVVLENKKKKMRRIESERGKESKDMGESDRERKEESLLSSYNVHFPCWYGLDCLTWIDEPEDYSELQWLLWHDFYG